MKNSNLLWATASLCVFLQTASAEERVINFNIPPQSAATALDALATQSDLQMLFNREALKNTTTQGLSGKFTAREALKKLLAGSGLIYTFTADDAVAVKPAAEQINKADPTTLKPMKVVGKATYNATDPYNPDYVLPNATAGTKTDTPIMETPLNVQVISKQVLKDQQVIHLGDALKNISGVTLGIDPADGVPDPFNQSIVVRGFNSSTYMRNGFRLQQGASSREMANVENIEVLKGSAAVLYGQVEPGGMVNIITKQPLATPYYAVNQQFGSYDLYRTTADATGPVASNKDVLYRMNMSYENSGSFRKNVSNEKIYLAPIIKWNISPRTQITAEMEYGHNNLKTDNQVVPRLNDQFLNVPISLNYGPGNPATQDTIFGGVNWSHQFNEDWSIKHSVSANHQKTDTAALSIYGPFLATAFVPGNPVNQLGGFYGTSTTTNDTYATNMDLTGHFDTAGLKHTLLLGGDYYRTNFFTSSVASFPSFVGINIINPTPCADSSCGLVTSPTSPINQNGYIANNDQYGLYLQDQIKLPYNVHVTGGFRYQNIHQQNFNQQTIQGPSSSADAVTPRVGLLWHPQNWLSLYSNYTENFGANLPYARVYVDDTTQRPPNPTSSQQWEVGTKTEFFNGRLRATFAYYNLTKQNVLAGDPNPLHCGGPNNCSIEIGAVRSRGPELDIQGEILPGWNAIATYANTDIIVTKGSPGDYPGTGERYFGVPRNTGSLWNTYDFQQESLKGLKIGGGVTLRSDQLYYQLTPAGANAGTTIPGYATVDLLTAYSKKVGGSKVTVQFNANNILDQHYYTAAAIYGSGLNTSAGYNAGFVNFGTPRMFMGSIRVEF